MINPEDLIVSYSFVSLDETELPTSDIPKYFSGIYAQMVYANTTDYRALTYYNTTACENLKDTYPNLGDIADGYYCPDMGDNKIELQGFQSSNTNK